MITIIPGHNDLRHTRGMLLGRHRTRHGCPTHRLRACNQLPPLSKGLQPSLSETADVWRGVLGGAAKGLMDHFNELDKHLKGPPSIAQTIVRAYQVRHILLPHVDKGLMAMQQRNKLPIILRFTRG